MPFPRYIDGPWNLLKDKINAIGDYFETAVATMVGKVKKSITTDTDGKAQLVNDLTDAEIVPDLVYGVDSNGVRGYKPDLGGKIGTRGVDDTGLLDDFILVYDAASGKWKVEADTGGGSATGFLSLPYLLWRHALGVDFTGYLDVQMQISTDPAFGATTYNLDSGTSPTGWKCFSAAFSTYLVWQATGMPATDVMGITYTGTLTLPAGLKYYMRWRVYEKSTTNFGEWCPGGSL